MSATALTAAVLDAWPLAATPTYADKDSRGRAMVVGGCTEVPGAVLLAVEAAFRAGAGKVQAAAPRSVATGLALLTPEARVLGLDETAAGEIAPQAADAVAAAAARCDAVLLGPGMLDEAGAGGLAAALAEVAGPKVVCDAAALSGLGEGVAGLRGRLVITPHCGEMARLCGVSRDEIEAEPLGWARRAAARLQAVVALKGAQTFIVTPEGQAWAYASECPGLGVSGSGDVLAGVITGLLAGGASLAQAAAWGVFVHGASGRRLAERFAPLGFLARELLAEIAPAIAEAA